MSKSDAPEHAKVAAAKRALPTRWTQVVLNTPRRRSFHVDPELCPFPRRELRQFRQLLSGGAAVERFSR